MHISHILAYDGELWDIMSGGEQQAEVGPIRSIQHVVFRAT